MRVPGDVAVIGYDDVMVASQTAPPLTTIRQDVARGAALMVDLLFDRLAGTETASACMMPQLVRRASA
jgi:DNA-binding LacI/PurR family transcriptional regulator